MDEKTNIEKGGSRMRTEGEIRAEIERLEKQLNEYELGDLLLATLSARKWALKWVLGEEK